MENDVNKQNEYYCKYAKEIKKDYYDCTSKYGKKLIKYITYYNSNKNDIDFKNYIKFLKKYMHIDNKSPIQLDYVRKGINVNCKLENNNIITFIREKCFFYDNIIKKFPYAILNSEKDQFTKQDYIINPDKGITGDYKMHVKHWYFEHDNDEEWLNYVPILKTNYNTYCNLLNTDEYKQIYLFNELVLFDDYNDHIYWKFDIIDFNKIMKNTNLNILNTFVNDIYNSQYSLFADARIYGLQLKDIQ